MLAKTVLAAGVTHLTDARYFAAWEVDYLVFPVGEAWAEGISWEYLEALREWITGPEIVVELAAGENPADWSGVLREHGVSTALIPSAAPASAPLIAAGIEVLVRVPIEGYYGADDVADQLAAHPEAKLAILDFSAGGITYADLQEGHPFGLEAVQQLAKQKNCLLEIEGIQGALNAGAMGDLKGYAVRGSSEEKVGYKSFDDLDELFEALEIFE